MPDLDLDPPDERTAAADVKLMVDEAKIGCMTGMLLCLDRQQRVVFVLGELFEVSSAVGAEITELARDNFRQQLARARRDLCNRSPADHSPSIAGQIGEAGNAGE